MEPKYKIFHDDEALSESIENLKSGGVSEKDIYVLAYDNSHVRRTKRRTDAKKIGVRVTGVGTATKNIFRNKSDKLVSKMKKIGFDQSKAQRIEKELNKGKSLLVVRNKDSVNF
ncbi:general stress protein [Halobacillus massiliensis]|uniref:general stress protein n=1 Tax=Halobacillus massiliensis TaxID=1926286 RepID=UPI0015C4A199|nr:general stress protein [Halobacillus massiliensis]